MSESCRLRPQFVDIAGRALFVLHHAPAVTPAKGRVLFLPPLMEEMNRSRRLMAMCGRRLSAAGYDVALADLSGTGDSAGEFASSRWDTWLEDMHRTREWLAQCSDGDVEILIAVRAGSLFLPPLLADHAPDGIVAWQPVLKGASYLQQVLRVRVMASRFAGQDESIKDLLAAFEAGDAVEVGGYSIGPGLAHPLLEIEFDDLDVRAAVRCAVIECKPGGSDTTTVSVQRLLASLDNRQCVTQAVVLDCEQFWATQEIAAPVEVIDQTHALLEQWLAAAQ